MPLPTEDLEEIQRIVDSGRLREVRIARGAASVTILASGGLASLVSGGLASGVAPQGASALPPVAPVGVDADRVGTLVLGRARVGDRVAAGDALAQLRVLDRDTPVAAPVAGRLAAIFADDGDLVAYGQALFAIDPTEPIDLIAPMAEGAR